MKLEKLKEWLDYNEFDYELEEDDEFCCDEDEEIIYCADEVPENSQKSFNKLTKDLGLTKNVDAKAMAFLHEIGHLEMKQYISPFRELVDMAMRRIINHSPNPCEWVVQLKYYIYHRMFKEKIATAWAINFIETYPNKVIQLQKILREC